MKSETVSEMSWVVFFSAYLSIRPVHLVAVTTKILHRINLLSNEGTENDYKQLNMKNGRQRNCGLFQLHYIVIRL